MKAALGLALLAAATMCGCAAMADTPALPTIALRNPGFENPPRVREICAEHWSCSMHAGGDSFRYVLDEADPASGKRSLCIERVQPEPWALAVQYVEHASLRAGTRLRLSVAVRGEVVDGPGAGPWAMVQGVPQGQRHFQRLVPRTRGWERIALDFPVAAGAESVEVGVTIEGGGRVCIDDARLEVLGGN